MYRDFEALEGWAEDDNRAALVAFVETCPYRPGRPVSAHWGLPDPAAAIGGDAEKMRAFEDAYHAMSRRIAAFVVLPRPLGLETLKARLREIGEHPA